MINTINFTTTKAESAAINRIAKRAKSIYGDRRALVEIEMDITATHLNGCPLDLNKLEKAKDFDFVHDIAGIARHLNRDTGKLMDHFRPRCALPFSDGGIISGTNRTTSGSIGQP